MKARRALLLCVCAGCAVFGAAAQQSAQTLDALVGSSRAAALVRGERLSEFQNKNPAPLLMPQDTRIRNMADTMIRALKPGFFAEQLLLYKKSGEGPWTEAERTALYNRALALSSLAGIKYYSHSRQEIRVLYETSSLVSGPDGKNTLSDPAYAVPPGELTVYVRQKDSSFGDNVYRYDYYAYSDSLVFIQENLTAMYYGIIPAIGKNKLRSIVAVFDAGEYLLIYAASMAAAASVPGMSGRVGNSFSSRVEAVLNWFTGQADKVFAK